MENIGNEIWVYLNRMYNHCRCEYIKENVSYQTRVHCHINIRIQISTGFNKTNIYAKYKNNHIK